MSMEIDRIIEFADNILTNNDIVKKRNGLFNLIKRILNDFPDTIPFVENNISSFPNWRYANYKDEIYMGYIGDTKKKMLTYINEHFSEITRYENDSEADLEVRKRKLHEYAQTIGISPKVKKVVKRIGMGYNTEVEYEYDPDIIYCQHGIYRKYWNYRNNQYFIFAINLRKSFEDYGFMDLSKKVFLYVSLKNELKQVEEEMELLGINIRGEESNNGINGCKYPIKDKYKPIIAHLYKELNEVAFSLTESAFGTAIENADLSDMYKQDKCIRNKIKYMIYILSKVMGNDWYACASGSINVTKGACSGANIEEEMRDLRKEIEKMISDIDKKK